MLATGCWILVAGSIFSGVGPTARRVTGSLIEKRNVEKANNEFSIMNIEFRSKVFDLFNLQD